MVDAVLRHDAQALQPRIGLHQIIEGLRVSQLASELDWGGASSQIQESRIYHLLAEFDLPLYITTNADSFMYEALKCRPHAQARRAGPQWSAGSQSYTLTPAPGTRHRELAMASNNPYVGPRLRRTRRSRLRKAGRR